MDNYSKYHIDSIIDGNLENAWQLIGFYGKLDTNHRTECWNTLRMLNSKPKLPWCFFGDFNELLEVEDKSGGTSRAYSQM